MKGRIFTLLLALLTVLAGIMYCTATAYPQEAPTLTSILDSIGDPPAVAANKVFWRNLESATPEPIVWPTIEILGVDRGNTSIVVFHHSTGRYHDRYQRKWKAPVWSLDSFSVAVRRVSPVVETAIDRADPGWWAGYKCVGTEAGAPPEAAKTYTP